MKDPRKFHASSPAQTERTTRTVVSSLFLLQVQKDIEIDQARLQGSAESPSAKTNSLLQPSTSNLTANFSYNHAQYPLVKPKSNTSGSKSNQPPRHTKVVEYNPTPIKELEKRKSHKNNQEGPSSRSSLGGFAVGKKRKTSSENESEAKRLKTEPEERVGDDLIEEEEFKAPDFSDLDASDSDSSKDRKKKRTKRDSTSKTGSSKRSLNGAANEFDVFEKSGKSSKSLNLLSVNDIITVNFPKSTETQLAGKVKPKSVAKSKVDREVKINNEKADTSALGSGSRRSSSDLGNNKGVDAPNKTTNAVDKTKSENIFEKLLSFEKLKAVAKKVVEVGKPVNKNLSPVVNQTSNEQRSIPKYKHSSSVNKNSSSGEKRKSLSSVKDKDDRLEHSTDAKHSHKNHKHSEKRHRSQHKHEKRSRSSSSHEGSSRQSRHRHHSSSKHSSRKEKHKSSRDSKDPKGSQPVEVGVKRHVSQADLFGEESDADDSAEVEVPEPAFCLAIECTGPDLLCFPCRQRPQDEGVEHFLVVLRDGRMKRKSSPGFLQGALFGSLLSFFVPAWLHIHCLGLKRRVLGN